MKRTDEAPEHFHVDKKRKNRGKKPADPAAAIAFGPDPKTAREHEALIESHPRTILTRAEGNEQRAQVAGLLEQGVRPAQIQAVLKQRWAKVTMVRVWALIGEVQAAWAKEDALFKDLAKGQQIRRLERNIRIAQGEQDASGKWTRKPDHNALARYERLLADIQGTIEPIKVQNEVVFTGALIEVIGRMSSDEASAKLQKAVEQKRLAEKAREMLPASILAQGEDVTNQR